jgi:hypothetical protein
MWQRAAIRQARGLSDGADRAASLWSAQESLIALQQTDLENRITLWQSLGAVFSSLIGGVLMLR